MHTADAAYGSGRALFGKVEECEQIASAHIEEDMRGGWLITILDNSREPHADHFGVKMDGCLEVRGDQRKVVDPARIYRLQRGRLGLQIASAQLFPPFLIKARVSHGDLQGPWCEGHQPEAGGFQGRSVIQMRGPRRRHWRRRFQIKEACRSSVR